MNKNGGNGEAYLNGKPAKNFYKNDKPLKNSSAGQWEEAKALQQEGTVFLFFQWYNNSRNSILAA